MKKPRIDTSGTEAAQRAVAQATEAATNLQKNFKTDLTNENLTNIAPGGTADAASMMQGGTRKRRQGGGLSSQLGINV